MTQEVTKQEDYTNQLAGIITKAATISGNRVTPEMVAIMAIETNRILREKYPNMPIAIVDKVIRAGVIGDYGEHFLNVPNINMWLKAYISEVRQREHVKMKREEEGNKVSIQEKASVLVQNIDKLPSLKRLLGRYD